MQLRVVQCGQCGGAIQLHQQDDQGVCRQCRNTVTRAQALQEEAKLVRRFPNPTPLRLGMKGRFLGKDYELIGRMVFGMREEGVTYYWHEFQMVAADGDVFFLEYEVDEGQTLWKTSRSFTPTHPLDPLEATRLSVGSHIRLEESSARVTQDATTATLFLVEGELTYAAQAGDKYSYIEAVYGNGFYVVEWKPDEVEFYQGHHLSYQEVLEAFALQEALARYHAAQTRQRSRGWFAGACVLVAILAFVGYGVARISGTEVAKGSTSISRVDPVKGYDFPQVITLGPSDRVLRLELQASMRQTSAWIIGVLISEDGNELVGLGEEFWDEVGVDSDGRWHEWDLQARSSFRITEPGNYRVRVYIQKDRPQASYGSVGYRLYAHALYPRYLMLLGIACTTLAVVFGLLAMTVNLARAVKEKE